jgi:aspartate ammonia-lyase
MNNFFFSSEKLRADLFHALIRVKQAAAKANYQAHLLDDTIARAISEACEEICLHIDTYIPPIHPLQGGAGTSTNMAANELIANIALGITGRKYGEYEYISPLAQVNLSQSTNDTYGTAFKIALIKSLHQMHNATEELLHSLLEKERAYAHILKVGRTELQDAMPLSLGQEFSAWAESISRFRWRIKKAIDWVREVNISGTAVGTGVNADRKYAAAVIAFLRSIVEEPLALSRNLVDATQNIDQIVEVSGLIKTGAVSVKKMCADIRLLSSGPHCGIGELELPKLQAGSSIMPGKVNPVMLEAAEQVCLQVLGGDATIAYATAESNLELPQFLPLIAHTLLTNNELFTAMMRRLAVYVQGIEPNLEVIKTYLNNSTAVATLLAPSIGYQEATELVQNAAASGLDIREYVLERNLLTEGELAALLTPEVMASPGLPQIIDAVQKREKK